MTQAEIEKAYQQELARKERNKATKKKYKAYRDKGYNAQVSKALSQRKGKIEPTQKQIDAIIKRESRNKANRQKVYKKRELVYKELGYDSKTSKALSRRALDVSKLEISPRTGKLKRNKITERFIKVDLKAWEHEKAVDNYHDKIKRYDADTNLSRWGMLTHDRRYRGETGRTVSIIKNENKLTNNQAYYLFYVMNQSGMTYAQAKTELLSSKDFEEYDARKKARKLKQQYR